MRLGELDSRLRGNDGKKEEIGIITPSTHATQLRSVPGGYPAPHLNRLSDNSIVSPSLDGRDKGRVKNTLYIIKFTPSPLPSSARGEGFFELSDSLLREITQEDTDGEENRKKKQLRFNLLYHPCQGEVNNKTSPMPFRTLDSRVRGNDDLGNRSRITHDLTHPSPQRRGEDKT